MITGRSEDAAAGVAMIQDREGLRIIDQSDVLHQWLFFFCLEKRAGAEAEAAALPEWPGSPWLAAGWCVFNERAQPISCK